MPSDKIDLYGIETVRSEPLQAALWKLLERLEMFRHSRYAMNLADQVMIPLMALDSSLGVENCNFPSVLEVAGKLVETTTRLVEKKNCPVSWRAVVKRYCSENGIEQQDQSIWLTACKTLCAKLKESTFKQL